MTKSEYLHQMQKYLKRLPKQEYEDAMEYFSEYLDEVGEENMEQVVREMGTPKEAASDILNHLVSEKLVGGDEKDRKPSVGKDILIAALAICAAPIGLPLVIVALAFILVAVIMAATLLICGFCLSLAGVLIAVKLVARGIAAFSVSVPGGLMILGMGLAAIGLCILFSLLVVYGCRWIGRGIAILAKKAGDRVRRKP